KKTEDSIEENVKSDETGQIRKNQDTMKRSLKKLTGEGKIEALVKCLLQRDASTEATDECGRTALHYAAGNGWLSVCQKLLDRQEQAINMKDKEGKTPYIIAVDNKSDQIGACILSYMPNIIAREIHTAQKDKKPEILLVDLLNKDMTLTIKALFDCLIDRCTPVIDTHEVHFKMLEADLKGFDPDHEKFNPKEHSMFHELAYKGDKNLIYHDAVRLLIKHKWKEFAKRLFIVSTIVYSLSIAILTFAVAVACQSPDPRVYDNPLQIVRGVAEILIILFVSTHFWLELRQIKVYRFDYLKDPMNYIDLVTILLLIAVTPLRYFCPKVQWYVYALGYVGWTMRILKYAAVWRNAGAFVQIIWIVVTKHMPQFIILFIIVLLAFSGSFQLALRGEDAFTVTTYHYGNTTIFGTMLIGLLTVVEQQPTMEYTDDTSNCGRWLSIIIMVVYLIACIIVLLNLLIASLTDTYQQIQQHSQRELELRRALIITRFERNSWVLQLNRNFRKKKHYKAVKEYKNYKSKLEKWERPPGHESNTLMKDIRDNVYDLQEHLEGMQRTIHKLYTQQEPEENDNAGLKEYLEMNI
ncbi:unnamed protein product, partial [Owenia fusiformis]